MQLKALYAPSSTGHTKTIGRAMRLTAFILLTACLQVAATGYTQITLQEKNVPLETVFTKIRVQSGLSIVYTRQMLEKTSLVTISLSNVSVETALNALFNDQPLTYSIVNNTIVIRPKEVIEMPVARPVSDIIDVKGRVLNENGEAIAGVSVRIKGAQAGTTTNDNGEFLMTDIETTATLIFSSTNIETIEINVKGRTTISVSVKTKINKLDEVQVQAYGTTNRRTSTGNIFTIKAEDIAKQPVDNPLYALIGRVPGLIVTPTSGMPGAPVKIQLRGQNSFRGQASEPLIVIDGIAYTNNIAGSNSTGGNLNLSALSFLNPADIASIDVLKDGDATAIYGSRGANGVILITTKRGKAGTTRVDVNVSSGYSKVTREFPLMKTPEYVKMRQQAFVNVNQPVPVTPGADNYDLTLWDQTHTTDWQKELLSETNQFTNATASISGGNSTVQYLIDGSFAKQGYVFKGDGKYENASGHFSVSGNSANEKFRVTLTGNYTANTDKAPVDFTGYAMHLAPNAPSLYTADGALNWAPDPNTGLASWDNPLALLLQTTTSKSNTMTAAFDLSYRIIPSLQLKTTFGFTNEKFSSFQPIPIASHDPATAVTQMGYSNFSNNGYNSFTFEPQALYNRVIGKGKFQALAGGTIQRTNSETQYIAANGYRNDALLHSLAAAPGFYLDNSTSQYKYAGIFARLTYNWDEKYILNLNGRRDGSSRFGPGKQYGNFGSAGAAWVFTNEKFAQKALSFMSFGKLRFSYGITGNDGVGDYSYLELYNPLLGATYQGITGLMTAGAVNDSYHWESVKKMEVGMELGFLNDRLIVTASFFRNRSSDQLTQLNLPATAGASSITINQPATIQNSGKEFTFNSINIKTKNFSWSSFGHIGFMNNKMIKMSDDLLTQYFFFLPYSPIGKPFANMLYLAQFEGVDPATGLYQFGDKDGKPVIEPYDVNSYAKAIRTDPEFTGGLANTFTYKDFSLDMFFQFTKQLGRSAIYSDAFVYPGSFNQNQPELPAGYSIWQQPGDIAQVQKPLAYFADYNTYLLWVKSVSSTAGWVDASFIRLKSLSLSYGIPASLKQKWHMQNLRVYVQAQNIFTITKYKGMDAETQNPNSLPPLRTIVAGISIGL